MSLFQILLPEILLTTTACVLFLLGFLGPRGNGRVAAGIALTGVLGALAVAVNQYASFDGAASDLYANFRVNGFCLFVRLVALAMGTLLLLLSWPFGEEGDGRVDYDGNASVHYGRDAGEYFGLMLLAFTGLILVPSANDLILLFMAIELASIPTYVLVAVSRPISVAQEAGVKYFFLGAMAAAVMLMGFAYLYGTTGSTDLHEIGQIISRTATVTSGPVTSTWQLLAGVLLVVGIGFKLAAVPMHAYVADVYQGAATPVTAVLGFVPKATGIIALTKILYVFAGGDDAGHVAPQLAKLVWILAVLTMTAGNLLAIMQSNVKRLFAYSSVAHSGYLLAALAFGLFASSADLRSDSVQSVLFYLATYGATSTLAFGALLLLPSRQAMEIDGRSFRLPATTAETFDDLAGAARTRPIAALLLAIACFSLVGLPLTGGFWGKYYLLAPAFSGRDVSASGWTITLAVLVLVNSAISAAYYLKVVAALFHRAEVEGLPSTTDDRLPMPVRVSVGLCAAAVVAIGVVLPGTKMIADGAGYAADHLDAGPVEDNGNDVNPEEDAVPMEGSASAR